MKNKTVILSLGGSIINPGRINIAFLIKFKSLIIRLTKQGYRFVIVAGGGSICRNYQAAANKVGLISSENLDWLGIAATKLNAELIRVSFGSYAYHQVIDNPTRKIKTNKKIIIGSGWQPGFSSDKDAVYLAKVFGATMLLNLSNIRYVYTADPRKRKSARPIKQMTWNELLKLTGRKWKPGAHVPFDPEAAKLAKKIHLSVVVCLGTDLANLRAIITNEKYQGTLIA